MNYNELDFNKLKEIHKQLNFNNSQNGLAYSVLTDTKTRIYLLNEFICQNQNMIVVIVKYWDGIKQKYNYYTCVWDKDLSIGGKL
jgi:hypothetical protein